jgi:hypothetical protein
VGRQALPVAEILSLLLNNHKDNQMKILLNETETAEQLSLKKNTLRKWRCLGKGPSFVKFGSAVRYEQAAIITFINDNIKQSTSEV